MWAAVRMQSMRFHTGRPKACVQLEASSGGEVSVVSSRDGRNLFITGHPEYDADTLQLEYQRDLKKGTAINPPQNLPSPPKNIWRAPAEQFYKNIIKHIKEIKEKQNDNI